MQIATICIGDSLVSVCQVQSLDKDDFIQFSYVLYFRDLPTGRTAEILADGEDHALKLLAAWIMLNEERLGVLDSIAADLRSRLPREFNL